MTQRLSTAEARKGFAAILRSSAAGERIKLTRYNKTVAVIIPKKDLAELEDCEQRKRASAEKGGHGAGEHAHHAGKHGRHGE